MFDILLTDEARAQLKVLRTDKGLLKRYKAVKKAILFLASNPRHPGLKTHEFTSLKGPKVKKSLRRTLSRGLRQHIEFSGTTDRRKPRSR